MSRSEARLRSAFVQYDLDHSGGLSVKELRYALIQSGESANAAKKMIEGFAADATELTSDEFVRAWTESGCGPVRLHAMEATDVT